MVRLLSGDAPIVTAGALVALHVYDLPQRVPDLNEVRSVGHHDVHRLVQRESSDEASFLPSQPDSSQIASTAVTRAAVQFEPQVADLP